MTEPHSFGPDLPASQHPGSPYTVLMVCLGNICRSPMAQVVLTDKLLKAGLAERARVRSCGTGNWHVGEEMDARAAATLTASGYDASLHRAAHFDSSEFETADVILAMDKANLRDIGRLATTDSQLDRVLMFRSFDPHAGGDLEVPDPWYGDRDGFADVLAMVERTTDVLVQKVAHLR
jgi:protein-tyrosine phosphatase